MKCGENPTIVGNHPLRLRIGDSVKDCFEISDEAGNEVEGEVQLI